MIVVDERGFVLIRRPAGPVWDLSPEERMADARWYALRGRRVECVSATTVDLVAISDLLEQRAGVEYLEARALGSTMPAELPPAPIQKRRRSARRSTGQRGLPRSAP